MTQDIKQKIDSLLSAICKVENCDLKPAKPEDIEQVESEIGFSLPEAYKYFLLKSDGISLCSIPFDEEGVADEDFLDDYDEANDIFIFSLSEFKETYDYIHDNNPSISKYIIPLDHFLGTPFYEILDCKTGEEGHEIDIYDEIEKDDLLSPKKKFDINKYFEGRIISLLSGILEQSTYCNSYFNRKRLNEEIEDSFDAYVSMDTEEALDENNNSIGVIYVNDDIDSVLKFVKEDKGLRVKEIDKVMDKITVYIPFDGKNTVFPDSATVIKDETFYNNVTIPNSVTMIKDYAFKGYPMSNIIIPNSVKKIGEGAFEKCTRLVNITIPDSVRIIGKRAFSYCEKLTGITISNSVNEIGNYAFENCNSLISITIPESVASIDSSAFGQCCFKKENFINNSSLDSEANNYWGATIIDEITEDGLYILDNVVLKCDISATSVVIPDSVKIIRYNAFFCCDELRSISVKSSKSSKLLKNVKLPDGAKVIKRR